MYPPKNQRLVNSCTCIDEFTDDLLTNVERNTCIVSANKPYTNWIKITSSIIRLARSVNLIFGAKISYDGSTEVKQCQFSIPVAGLYYTCKSDYEYAHISQSVANAHERPPNGPNPENMLANRRTWRLSRSTEWRTENLWRRKRPSRIRRQLRRQHRRSRTMASGSSRRSNTYKADVNNAAKITHSLTTFSN